MKPSELPASPLKSSNTLDPMPSLSSPASPDAKAPWDTDYIMRDMVLNNQLIYGTVNAPPGSFAAAISDIGTFMKRWPDALKRIITGRFPIEDALQPLSGKVAGIKNIITINND